MTRTISPWTKLYPATAWLFVLAIILLTEYLVMLVLPWLLPGNSSRFLEAAVDAVTLTAVLSPVIWWTVLRPLQEVNRLRTRFLTDLFTRIEADRRRTAHELHDGVGQSLSLLVSGLRSAHKAVTDPEIADRCERLLLLAQESLHDVKRLARGLRPSVLDDLGLAPALERLVTDIQEHHPVAVTLDATEVANVRLGEAVETAVFRIVQEALANVVEHAEARRSSVVVGCRNGHVIIDVTDDGHGIAPAVRKAGAPGHLGLTGMKERVTLLGGRFALQSAPERGTRVTALIPVGG